MPQPNVSQPVAPQTPGAPYAYSYQAGGQRFVKTVRKKSMIPFYLVGLFWIAYAWFLPLYRWWDFLMAAVASVLLFVVARLLIADKVITVPLSPLEVQKMMEDQRRLQEEVRLAKEKEEEARSGIPPEAMACLQQIHDADAAIEDEAVSQKIRLLEDRTRRIFQAVTEKPEKKADIRKFMNYYLPTLVKLLHSYDRLEEQGVKGNNIRYTMGEIERILDTVLAAFDKQLDNLFQDEAMDISSDIRVLENVMEQEGLVTKDFVAPPAADAGGTEEPPQ